MPVTPGTVTCVKCGEDRPTLIHEVTDPRGKWYVCMVCSNDREFRVGAETLKYAVALMAVLTLGCASMTERIVHDGLKGLVYDADYNPREGGNPEALAALYAHLTKELKIEVQYLPAEDEDLRGAYGLSWRTEESAFIRLRQDLSVNGSIEVLCHEAAHLFQPPHLTRSQGDVFAEIVSAHVAHRLGVPNTAATSALWLRQHKPSLRMALDLQNEIKHVVKILTPSKF